MTKPITTPMTQPTDLPLIDVTIKRHSWPSSYSFSSISCARSTIAAKPLENSVEKEAQLYSILRSSKKSPDRSKLVVQAFFNLPKYKQDLIAADYGTVKVFYAGLFQGDENIFNHITLTLTGELRKGFVGVYKKALEIGQNNKTSADKAIANDLKQYPAAIRSAILTIVWGVPFIIAKAIQHKPKLVAEELKKICQTTYAAASYGTIERTCPLFIVTSESVAMTKTYIGQLENIINRLLSAK